MKAQVSIEYLMIVGFVVVITIPLLLIYYTYTENMSDEVVSSQVSKIAKKVVDSAETVYYLGEPSQTTIRAYIPKGVEDVVISDREITYKVRAGKGVTDVVQISNANLTGSLPTTQGIHFITVKAAGNKVELSYT